MAFAWLVQRTTGHTGWIDVCWTFGTGIVAALGSLAPFLRWAAGRTADHGCGPGRVLVAAPRWAYLLRTREIGDDPRYRDLIRQWGANADMRMFRQLQSQAAVGLILAVSVALAANAASESRLAGFPWRGAADRRAGG